MLPLNKKGQEEFSPLISKWLILILAVVLIAITTFILRGLLK
jgi:hypothetical protein